MSKEATAHCGRRLESADGAMCKSTVCYLGGSSSPSFVAFLSSDSKTAWQRTTAKKKQKIRERLPPVAMVIQMRL